MVPDEHADPLVPRVAGREKVLDGKPFATASISRRYYSINLGQQRKLGEKNGGRFIDKTHFVVAGGQVKSMLSWLGYMKHGEPQERVFGLKMPPPNLKPDFEEQAGSFVNGFWRRFSPARGRERGEPDDGRRVADDLIEVRPASDEEGSDSN